MNKQISGKDSNRLRELSNEIREVREEDLSLTDTLDALCKITEDINDIINRYTIKYLNRRRS